MGFLGLGIVLLLVGILLITLVTRMTARNLKLTLLAFIFIIAATAVIFAIAGRYGLAAPAGAWRYGVCAPICWHGKLGPLPPA